MTALTIAPVGTCRVHTPLRKGAARYPIKALLERNYGFVHTSSEVLQQLRFMFGQQDIPANVQRLTFRSGTSAESYRNVHTPADLYFVELSSRKLLTVDGCPIQVNYMGRYFSDFFADRDRTRMFWSMASEERLLERRSMLDRDPVFLRLASADRDLLASVLRRDLDDSEIEREMLEIAELVGKDKLVFVTHVNAYRPDGTPIEQRQRLIHAVSSMARRLKLRCYDPTPRMREFGQANAMENGGLDLTHYTDEFAEHLCADLYRRYMRQGVGEAALPKQPASNGLKPGDDVASIEAVWNAGQLREASRRVRKVLSEHPDRPDHRLLLARMEWELGAYEGAIGLLESGRDETGSGEKADQLLMHCYFDAGRYGDAQRLAMRMMADESETPEILRVCAVSAQHCGDTEAALSSWKRLFRLSRNTDEAATAVLDILIAKGDDEGAAHWADEVRETLRSHGRSFAVQWDRRVKDGDRAGLLKLAEENVDLDEHAALALAARAADRGLATPAAVLAVNYGLPRSTDPEVTGWLSRKTSEWLQKGVAALESGDLREAADTIQARSQLAPMDSRVIRAMQALERQLRLVVRRAFMARDYAAVASLIDFVLQIRITFPELNSFRGRAADALGDTQTALVYLKKAADEAGAPTAARIRLARVAFRTGHYGDAIDAYCEVLNAQAIDDATREEVVRQLAVSRSRSIRAARERVVQGEYVEAWALLDRVEKAGQENADVQRERKRVLAALYSKLRETDPDSAGERLALGETILRLAPTDTVGLKAAALGAMRSHRFADALKHWEALQASSDNAAQYDTPIRKCRAWMDKATRKRAA
jgi:tetratricopeptide (TPR) repeat protein